MAAAPSWGEWLLPYLFIAMETCWVAAILLTIAGLNMFQTHTLLIPLWAPFILMASTHWLALRLERGMVSRETTPASKNSPGMSLVFCVITVITLFVIWSSVYANTTFFLNPSWLGLLISDILFLNATAFHIGAVFVLTLYFCWRGIQLARREIEPADVFNTLRIGTGIMLLALLIQMGAGIGSSIGFALLLLMPIFLALALMAHALAQALFLRHVHTVGLQGSVVAQERSLLMVIAGIGLLLLLVSLLVGTLANPAFLAQVQHALAPIGVLYDLLATWIAYAIVFLLTPIFWLISLLHPKTQLPTVRHPKPLPAPRGHGGSLAPTLPASVIAALPFIKALLPLLFAALLVVAIIVALRVRRVILSRRSEEQHESLWSWQLFWTQLRAFLLAFWRRFFPTPFAHTQGEAALPVDTTTEPAARTIREIYRAFLQWAAAHGYVRKKNETPDELKIRLNAQLPEVGTEVGVMTAAYNDIRYGGIVPDDAEVQRVQQVWTALRQKI